VEKSFWQSPWLQPKKIEENLTLGLEQAKDTIMPNVYLKKLFKPFIEDELPTIAENSQKWVAHPGSELSCPRHFTEQSTLIIGPEGGFVPYEINRLQEQGFKVINMGPRILRVETAVTTLLGRF
jgi:RsmE family RNA methyltransferase